MPIEPIIHNHADEAFRSSIPQLALGRRICIYGHGGKTTLSNALGKLTNLPVIELDAIFWMPHWRQRDKNEMLDIVSQKLDSYSNGWIVEGNYRHIIPHLLPQADTVIWLNMHHIITTLKTAKRTLINAIKKNRICGDNYESLLKALGPSSIIWYKALNTKQSQHRIATLLHNTHHSARVYEIKSYPELNIFYNAFGINP